MTAAVWVARARVDATIRVGRRRRGPRREALGEQRRLAPTLVVQRRIEVALEPPLAVPGGDAVPDEQEPALAHREAATPSCASYAAVPHRPRPRRRSRAPSPMVSEGRRPSRRSRPRPCGRSAGSCPPTCPGRRPRPAPGSRMSALNGPHSMPSGSQAAVTVADRSAGLATSAKPEGLQTGLRRRRDRLVAGPGALAALLGQAPHADLEAVQHGSPPVSTASGPSPPSSRPRRSPSRSAACAPRRRLPWRARTEGGDGDAGRRHPCLLAGADDEVDAPGVHLERHRAEAADAVDDAPAGRPARRGRRPRASRSGFATPVEVSLWVRSTARYGGAPARRARSAAGSAASPHSTCEAVDARAEGLRDFGEAVAEGADR